MDTIEHPITGEKIRIAKSDFSDRMGWEEANAACNALGSGWRLPNKEELNEMYINKDTIGGFIHDIYWCSSYNPNDCFLQDFKSGVQHNYADFNDGYWAYFVRAVRDL